MTSLQQQQFYTLSLVNHSIYHLITSLADSEEPVLVPHDQQESHSSPNLTDEVVLRHLLSFLAQLDPQPVPMFTPPIIS